MKRFFTFFLAIFIGTSLIGQSEVIVNIEHLMAGEAFDWSLESTNDLGHKFTFDRLEYYISQIGVIHDGGQETNIADLYILVDPSFDTEINLGELAVEDIEGLNFSIGVDRGMNHNDPSALPSSHPLAPKNPSMHWGWNAGYRFVAMEGSSGSNLNVTFQFHGLGDDNYKMTTLNMAAQDDNGRKILNVIADYDQSVLGIDLNAGPISHGDSGPAKSNLLNFNSKVFRAASGYSDTKDIKAIADISVYPNPVSKGNVTIESDKKLTEYSIVDMTGKVIDFGKVDTYELSVTLNESGIFILNMMTEEGSHVIKKITVN